MEKGILQPLTRSPKGLSSRGVDHGFGGVLTLENMQVGSEYVLTPKMLHSFIQNGYCITLQVTHDEG